MRLIYESDNDEDFLEVVLNPYDLYKIKNIEGTHGNFPYGIRGRNINFFIRRSNDTDDAQHDQ